MRYQANFKYGNGVVVRVSDHRYKAAWAVYDQTGKCIGEGFAKSEADAYKRAAAYERKCVRNGVSVTAGGHEVVPAFVQVIPTT
jgi:hypothetical protein